MGQALTLQPQDVVWFRTLTETLVSRDHDAQLLIERPAVPIKERVVVGTKEHPISDVQRSSSLVGRDDVRCLQRDGPSLDPKSDLTGRASVAVGELDP